jgi:hypothetical protein
LKGLLKILLKGLDMTPGTSLIVQHGILSRPEALLDGIFALVATTHHALMCLKLKLQDDSFR